MENCYLRNLQLVALFDCLQPKRGSLRILDLSLNNMAGIDGERLAVIINDVVEVKKDIYYNSLNVNLPKVNLSQTKLTASQAKELFKVMGDKTKIEILKINEVDLSTVPANILTEALIKVFLHSALY